ncbi:hypothetical protein HGRIS_010669 [Hohenbuehelia grisea]|uniref:Meiotically up-regulated protein Msb1/Mug8 domain-containing protein n=1 Tax=Hohenbuehelia grisea TaxID=104357 RepID=A0ABR3IXI0_9AGAR
MHSLFSRSRTNSTPKKPQADEFGALSSPASKKSKKKQLAPTPEPVLPDNSFLPTHFDRPRDEFGGFVPPKENDYGYLSYERHVVLSIDHAACLVEVLTNELVTRGGVTTPFIFSSVAMDASSAAVRRLIKVFLEACREGISPDPDRMGKAERRWREEARFAGPHELGMCLRWGLARVVRIQSGQEVRGLLSWDAYREFRDTEAATGYPATHFATLLPPLPVALRAIILTTLSLFTRLTANSTSSGHTPPTLSTLFGPLFFGLTGPSTSPGLRYQTFQQTYSHYLEAVNAMEHLILAFIRWQDAPSARPGTANSTQSAVDFDQQLRSYASGSAATSLGVPTRLKEWIKGYPAMLYSVSRLGARGNLQARRGARTVRVVSVRRNVRVYTKDLVRSGATWGYVPPILANRQGSSNGLASSREWQRVAPPALKLPPKYSDPFKKRMDMGPNVQPEFAPGSSSATASPTLVSASPSLASSTSSYLSSTSTLDGLSKREGDDRFRSLTDLKWGEFESMGFGGLGRDDEAERKLQFDLNESARMSRAEKRQTLSWNDFSSAGFSRTDVPLSATLQFSTPLSLSVSSFSERETELNRKLRKAQQQSNKGLPPFTWDMSPILAGEEVVEEGFVDVFCDLVWGTGWMEFELERLDAEALVAGSSHTGIGKEADWVALDRDCNWALVEFKSLPHSNSPSTSPTTISLSVPFSATSSASASSATKDPRTSTTLFLFEEFIPSEYRQKLRAALGTAGRRRLPSLFSSSSASLGASTKSSKLKAPPNTVNGRSAVSPSPREVEFEGMLRGGSGTKMLSLGSSAPASAGAPALPTTPNARSTSPKNKSKDDSPPPPPPPASSKKPRFRFPGGLPVSPGAGLHRKGMYSPAEYSRVDFETRLASYSDDEQNSNNGNGNGQATTKPTELEEEKQKRRQSRDDAWVDILVATHNRRMGGQDAQLKPGMTERERRRRAREHEPDPELASLEVAQVLASVQYDRSMSPDEEFARRYAEPQFDIHDALVGGHDEDVVEIQTVPRKAARAESEASVPDDEGTVDYASSMGPEPIMEPVLGFEEEEDIPVLPRRQSKGLGYFDLHPDRRRMTFEDDDPRARLAYDEDSDEEPTKDPNQQSSAPDPALAHASTKSLRPLPQVPQVPDEPEHGVTPPAKPVVAITEVDLTPARLNGHEDGLLPVVPSSVIATPPKVQTGSKVAAVLEMYRERERSASPNPAVSSPVPLVPTIQPSRLPVRVSPVPEKEKSPSPISADPQPIVTPPSIVASPEADIGYVEPPRIHLEETGRSSPARYVHGAPLHNVIEEEEEE